MVNDKLFQKRRELKEKEAKRRRKRRSDHKMILILCEGQKTEPTYFKAFRNSLRPPDKSIVIPKSYGGVDPSNLVNKAEEEFSKALKDDPPGYDRVFIVFDRDMHTTYDKAKQRVDNLNKNHENTFEAIVSIPCFEFWLLLHFENTDRPYQTMIGSKSACECVISDLKNYLPAYEKGKSDTFKITCRYIDEAMKRAELQEKRHITSDMDNYSTTKVHHLIEYIVNL
ncbi:MAG: RloB domain-containing protein [Nitrospirae bacterium]|nr:RloB domain-containing protein [Nitrospirota bacterium]